MNIGTFTRDGEKFSGTVTTLTLKAKVTIQPSNKTKAAMPDYRIYASGAEIGAAWTMISKGEQRPYLSVKLDDPSFGGAIYCRLIELESGQHRLLWSR